MPSSAFLKLVVRGTRLAARFLTACEVFGLSQAGILYGIRLRSDKLVTIRLKKLDRLLHFRGKADYYSMTLLLEDNFYVEPRGWSVTTVVDVGANIGIETLRFAAFYPESRI